MCQNPPKACILCCYEDPSPFVSVKGRDYFHCEVCDLVFLHPSQRPNQEEELKEYQQHNNDPCDPGYRRHLRKLTDPLLDGLPVSVKGLDFGAGPGPAISAMLGEQGFEVANYDPYFSPDKGVLLKRYDFICCSEVAEHFYQPAEAFDLIGSLLAWGGRLGVMTQFRPKEIEFADWYYIKQSSHVTFYNETTFCWLAETQGWSIKHLKDPIVIFEILNS